MTSFVDVDDNIDLGFSIQELADTLLEAVMDYEKCPYEVSVNLMVTDSETVKELNREHRHIDNTTDVLSFPALEYETPGDFDFVEDYDYYFDPESGELMLGDIVINIDRVYSQADEYGHSGKREFAFLMTHSLFHLCGYDHMEDDERVEMERRQKEVLDSLGIMRD